MNATMSHPNYFAYSQNIPFQDRAATGPLQSNTSPDTMIERVERAGGTRDAQIIVPSPPPLNSLFTSAKGGLDLKKEGDKLTPSSNQKLIDSPSDAAELTSLRAQLGSAAGLASNLDATAALLAEERKRSAILQEQLAQIQRQQAALGQLLTSPSSALLQQQLAAGSAVGPATLASAGLLGSLAGAPGQSVAPLPQEMLLQAAATSRPTASATTTIPRTITNSPEAPAANDVDKDLQGANFEDGRRKPKGGVAEPFPQKLHRMLKDLEAENKSDIVSFFPHGRAFAIHKPRRFMSEVMPRYFRMSRLSSFQRQLNLYGFKRITEGRDKGGYYHELFLRGQPELCKRLRRTKVKDKGQQQAQDLAHTVPDSAINEDSPSSLYADPNFYNMPPVEGRDADAAGGGSLEEQQLALLRQQLAIAAASRQQVQQQEAAGFADASGAAGFFGQQAGLQELLLQQNSLAASQASSNPNALALFAAQAPATTTSAATALLEQQAALQAGLGQPGWLQQRAGMPNPKRF